MFCGLKDLGKKGLEVRQRVLVQKNTNTSVSFSFLVVARFFRSFTGAGLVTVSTLINLPLLELCFSVLFVCELLALVSMLRT